jgi:hypothetical protein
MHATPTLTTGQRRTLLALLVLVLLVAGAVAVAAGPPSSQADDAAEVRGASAGASDAATTATPKLDQATTTTTPEEASGDDPRVGAAAIDVGSGETPEDDLPEVPDEDDDGPGPWFPPHHGVDGFATPPLVLDLVAPVDPQVNPDLEGGPTGLSGGPIQCDGQCIERATVQPGGTSATFELHTTVPARLWVAMDAPAVQDTGSRVRDWEVTFDGLTPDTVYNVVLVAEDQHGNLNHRYGQVRTLERHVELTFTSIHVVDDADKWDVNKGEVEWFFEVDGDWIQDFHRGVAKIKSGRTVNLGEGRRLVIDDADRFLRLAVQGWEHDGGKCFAGTGPFPDDFGGDVAGCRDVATAVDTIDLDNLAADDPALPVGYDAAFMLRTRAHYLQFDAYGTIDVWYG